MLEIIAIVVLISSIFGIGIIIYKKISILKKLPELDEKLFSDGFLLKIKKRIKNISILKLFSFEVFLQKILSKTRVLSLKIDNKTFGWLKKLRERSQKVKIKEKNRSIKSKSSLS